MKNNRFFGTLDFYAQALRIAVPIMLQMLVQSLVSLIDNFMVAGLGDVKMSGVNLVNHLLFIILTLFVAVASAGGMFMSQYSGAKDRRGMQQVFRFKQITILILALMFIITFLLFPRPLLGLLVSGNAASPAILDQAQIYLKLILITFIPFGLSIGISSSLREIGIVKPPMVISIISALINTLFNYLLIYGKFGFPRLEVTGAAYATILARVTELIIFALYIKKHRPAFYVKIHHLLQVRISLFFTILRKSALVFVSDVSWVMSETVSMALYNTRGGADVVSGMSAGWAITNLAFLIYPALSAAMGVIIGGTLGKGDFTLAKKQARWLQSGGILLGFGAGAVTILSTLIVPIAFGSLSSSAQMVARRLLIMATIYMPFWTFINTLFSTARAGGDVITGVWMDMIGNVFIFIPVMAVLTFYTNMGPVLLYGVAQIPSLVRIPIAFSQLKKERWVHNLTTQY